MKRKTEEEFINEGMTPEELAIMNEPQDGGEPAVVEPVVDDGADQGGVVTPDQPDPAAEPKMVDVRAVQEARAEARAAREELKKLQMERIERERQDATERARLEERLSLINQAFENQAKTQQPQAKVPSKDEDPLAFYDYELERVNSKYATLEQQLKAIEEEKANQAKEYAAEQQRQAIVSEASTVIDLAIERDPNIGAALNHALNGLRAEIAQMVEQQQVPLHQRAAAAEQLWRNTTAQMARRCPRDPAAAADYVLRHAHYYGFGIQPAQPAQIPQPAAANVPALAEQPAAQAQRPTVQQRAEQQQRHQSLSGIQGGSAPLKLSAKDIANMDEKEFAKLLKTAAGRQIVEEEFGGF